MRCLNLVIMAVIITTGTAKPIREKLHSILKTTLLNKVLSKALHYEDLKQLRHLPGVMQQHNIDSQPLTLYLSQRRQQKQQASSSKWLNKHVGVRNDHWNLYTGRPLVGSYTGIKQTTTPGPLEWIYQGIYRPSVSSNQHPAVADALKSSYGLFSISKRNPSILYQKYRHTPQQSSDSTHLLSEDNSVVVKFDHDNAVSVLGNIFHLKILNAPEPNCKVFSSNQSNLARAFPCVSREGPLSHRPVEVEMTTIKIKKAYETATDTSYPIPTTTKTQFEDKFPVNTSKGSLIGSERKTVPNIQVENSNFNYTKNFHWIKSVENQTSSQEERNIDTEDFTSGKPQLIDTGRRSAVDMFILGNTALETFDGQQNNANHGYKDLGESSTQQASRKTIQIQNKSETYQGVGITEREELEIKTNKEFNKISEPLGLNQEGREIAAEKNQFSSEKEFLGEVNEATTQESFQEKPLGYTDIVTEPTQLNSPEDIVLSSIKSNQEILESFKPENIKFPFLELHMKGSPTSSYKQDILETKEAVGPELKNHDTKITTYIQRDRERLDISEVLNLEQTTYPQTTPSPSEVQVVTDEIPESRSDNSETTITEGFLLKDIAEGQSSEATRNLEKDDIGSVIYDKRSHEPGQGDTKKINEETMSQGKNVETYDTTAKENIAGNENIQSEIPNFEMTTSGPLTSDSLNIVSNVYDILAELKDKSRDEAVHPNVSSNLMTDGSLTKSPKPNGRENRFIPVNIVHSKNQLSTAKNTYLNKKTIVENFEKVSQESKKKKKKEDVLLPVIPVIVQELRSGNVSESDRKVLKEVFGDRWPNIEMLARKGPIDLNEETQRMEENSETDGERSLRKKREKVQKRGREGVLGMNMSVKKERMKMDKGSGRMKVVRVRGLQINMVVGRQTRDADYMDVLSEYFEPTVQDSHEDDYAYEDDGEWEEKPDVFELLGVAQTHRDWLVHPEQHSPRTFH